MMTTEARIAALAALGTYILANEEALDGAVQRAYYENRWFTPENCNLMLRETATHYLQHDALHRWAAQYHMPDATPKQVALVLAGNIPMVGFHDVLCVFLAGHVAQIKLSDKDSVLIPFLLEQLARINPATVTYFQVTSRLADFDAVIATGSNNSARYFELYFAKVPHLIRQSRNAVAVLTGQETHEDYIKLGKDVFRYFGLGCRNVSKLYLPRGFDFNPLLEALHTYNEIILHDKYKNNFDYNYALYIMNRMEYQANGCIIMTENKSIPSRIAGLFYEYYDDMEQVAPELEAHQEQIQCVVSLAKVGNFKHFYFGEAQSPALDDYADGVDTMAFLLNV